MKQGRPCSGCLPGRQGACLNLGDPAGSNQCSSGSTALVSAAVCTSTDSPPVLLVGAVSPIPLSTSSQQAYASALTGNDPCDLPCVEPVLPSHFSSANSATSSARVAWARVFGEAVRAICSEPTSEVVWVKFFMLAKCILANPPRGGRRHWRDTQKFIQARIAAWRAGECGKTQWMQPLFWSTGLGSVFPTPPPSAESNRSTNARRARRAVENGQYKKATQSLSSAGFAPPSEDVLDEMLAKHPQSGASPSSFDEAPPPVQVAIVDVVNALRSFPSGTAPGPSCLRANHVKEAVFLSREC